jgi:hypothetical protein
MTADARRFKHPSAPFADITVGHAKERLLRFAARAKPSLDVREDDTPDDKHHHRVDDVFW